MKKQAAGGSFYSKNSYGGFTLIELLVVIAIIGILSSVILGSLNTARAKSKDAKAKSELASVRSQGNLYFDDNAQSYGADGTTCNNSLSVFDPSGTNTIHKLISDAELAVVQTATCANSVSSYVVALPLIGGNNWCVDSTGYAGITNLALDALPGGLQTVIACK